jgi:putative Ca2+/H+ antiporter (TMEM165/GDT1 family)
LRSTTRQLLGASWHEPCRYAEWGDITQVTAADLAARYGTLPVFAGPPLGLWVIAAAAVSLGAKSLDVISLRWIRQFTAAILARLGVRQAGELLVPAPDRPARP